MITVHYIMHTNKNIEIYTLIYKHKRGSASEVESFGVDGEGDFTSNIRPYNSRISQFFSDAF